MTLKLEPAKKREKKICTRQKKEKTLTGKSTCLQANVRYECNEALRGL